MSTIIAPYFISILLSFPLVLPSDGWIQWVYRFPNKATCEEFLKQEEEQIFMTVTRSFISTPHEIVEFRCMTAKEGAQANKALGHNTNTNTNRKPTVPRV